MHLSASTLAVYGLRSRSGILAKFEAHAPCLVLGEQVGGTTSTGLVLNSRTPSRKARDLDAMKNAIRCEGKARSSICRIIAADSRPGAIFRFLNAVNSVAISGTHQRIIPSGTIGTYFRAIKSLYTVVFSDENSTLLSAINDGVYLWHDSQTGDIHQ